MSKPIRNHACGCIMATRGNRNDKKPFWAWYGYGMTTEKKTCPIHILIHHSVEIMNLAFKVIGHLEYNEGNFSRYITIDKHKNRSIFYNKDVYCNQCECWHFKGLD